ncbi:DNA replication/repair protein RecF [Pontibaca methylaminivorans]|uniref:DNA replication and repair protein RecF n=1 Tax=Pontibaca methylaminivorans TaxID=515897 RepID=A0A1R3WTG1_9RHOB|nr:DNA replication/repair protein RecF [Pontibaca methylaminivorans]SIT81220.1 DNA replication and repair protein RecF [Pontibaca methylaminivorans]
MTDDSHQSGDRPAQAAALLELGLLHFRSHGAARLALDTRPVVLFGPNGAGKTNLLEAVSLLSPGRGLRRATPGEIARRPDAPGWVVRGTVRTQAGLREVETRSERGASREVRIDGKLVPQLALGRLLRILWLIPSMDRLWIEGAEGRRRFLDRVTMSFVPDHAGATLDYEKAMRERNRLLKDQVTDPGWYEALEAQMARAGTQIHQNRLAALGHLRAAQEGAETAFPAAGLALDNGTGGWDGAEGTLREMLAQGRARDMAAGRTLAGPHRADLLAHYAAKGINARDCSTGEQKALLLSLILANARALAALGGEVPVLLLDEVAAHLDAGRRAALYDEICALGAQAWMTGTERAIFDDLGRRAQFIHVGEAAGLSTLDPD